jgi:hypothetical protein
MEIAKGLGTVPKPETGVNGINSPFLRDPEEFGVANQLWCRN